MIIYGWRRKTLSLGAMGAQPCAQCGFLRPFTMMLNYSYFCLYFIFGVITRRRYIAACNVCGRGAAMDKSQVKSVIRERSVPFMDKWGLAVLMSAIVAITFVITSIYP